MPNTLAHIGAQTLASKACWKGADFRWISVGCIIPDIPWIVQRGVYGLVPGINTYDLRLYSMVQASLFFSLLLCGAFSRLAKESGKIFALLAINCLFHLLLDALQIKWANGVHLFAPFSWKLTDFQLYWPEQKLNYMLSLLGLATLIFFAVKDGGRLLLLSFSQKRLTLSALLVLIYFLSPPLFFHGPLRANNHYIATLQNKASRPGQYVEIDRNLYDPENKKIQLFSGEWLTLTGLPPGKGNILSLQGRFVDEKTVQVQSYHFHSSLRDISSMIGLAGILLVWLLTLLKKRIRLDWRHSS